MRPPPGPAGGDGGFISRVLVATFETMERRGDGVMMPFLQVRRLSHYFGLLFRHARCLAAGCASRGWVGTDNWWSNGMSRLPLLKPGSHDGLPNLSSLIRNLM